MDDKMASQAVALSRSHSKSVPDPTAVLREALVEFEAVLMGDEQKQLYKVSAIQPDVTSVITFVTEIDANNKSTTRRCVASRLCTFLEATQQFSGVVGTFVSSNPYTAALVWGGVKVAILTASNITSYFGKVTSMIMEIGKSCPTYQQFGQLYPGCVGLQRELCEYYATIVELCTKIIKISRRPLVTQTLSSIFSPFESDFKPSLDKLNQTTKNIQLQLSLASMQANDEAKKLLRQESQDNTAFRSLTKRFQKETRKEHTEAHLARVHMMEREAAGLRCSIKKNLSTINYVKPWRRAIQQRVPATAEWLLQDSTFQQWRDDEDTAFLWCTGIMGTGKTILMSNVVAQFHATRKPNEVISYYFCRSDDTAALSARNIIGSLARQILDFQIQHAENESLQRLYDDSNDLDMAGIVDYILPQLQVDKKYYIVIDGLDECKTAEARKVARAVSQLAGSMKDFKVLYAGRPDLANHIFRSRKPKYTISITEQRVELEMDRYIAATLDSCLEDGTLVLGDDTLIVRISETLRKGSDGMFLWTYLFIEELCARRSDSEILDALKHVPRGLSEIFDQKLSRVREKTTAKDAFKILQFCGVVKRPLTATEYQEALSLSPGQKSLDREKLPNDMHKVIGDCCGLTIIDEEDNTVHYVHHSVKQHLFSINCKYSEEFIMERLDTHIGILCMTYLDFSDFKRQLAKVQVGSNTPLHPLQLGTSVLGSYSNKSNRVARKLLLYRHQFQHLSSGELERKVQQVLGDKEAARLEKELQMRGFHLLEYAKYHWIDHLTNTHIDTANAAWSLFCRCVEGNDIIAYKPWESAQESFADQIEAAHQINWLVVHENFPLLMYYVRHQSYSLTESDKRDILRGSIMYGHHRITRYIIQHHDEYGSQSLMNYGLCFASGENRKDLLPSLLKVSTNVDYRVNGETALQVSARKGHLEVVERLLAAKADVNAPAEKTFGLTALQAAARGGHIEVMERLLDAGADVNAPAGEGNEQIALRAAGDRGRFEAAERLLAAKADVNAPAEKTFGLTSLQAAARGGHLEVVKRLLNAGADVNAPAGEGNEQIALRAAGDRGRFEAAERLLAVEADVNALVGEIGGLTALQAAAEGGHLEVVELLLDAAADVNAPAEKTFGLTALQAAAEGGHLEVVERLLDAGADVNAPAGKVKGRRALKVAEKGGHVKVVERLRRAGAK